MEEIFDQKNIRQLLHQVLENKETLYRDSYFSRHDKKYGYNQYSMLIIMDFLIKYQIIIHDNSLLEDCIRRLQQIVLNFQTHQELVEQLNELLGDLVKTKLQIEDTVNVANKRIILRYIYDRYIVHGYCFHSFPSTFRKTVEKIGLDPRNYQYPIAEMKKIAYIFEHHNYKNIITKDLGNKAAYLTITDSPAMAYFYAFGSPSYFSNLCATGHYYKEGQYDREAYYRKDKKACYQNLKMLCHHVHLSEKEKKTVLGAFERQWSMLVASKLRPCIAFIKRSDIGKDNLLEIDKILEHAKDESLSISIARILDSRYTTIRRYSELHSSAFVIYEFPTYDEIKNLTIEAPADQAIKIEKEDIVEDETPYIPKHAFHYGYADVLALVGLFAITLGMTLIIMLQYFGG